MKVSIAAIFAAAVSTVYAQTTAAATNAGVAVNKPGFGVRIRRWYAVCLD